MSYVVCRAEKLKTAGNVGGSAAHIQRTRPTPNADPARMGLNRVLVGAAGDNIPALVAARIEDHGVKTRKNSVQAFEVLLSASPDYFRPEAPEVPGTWDAARLEPWVDASQKWLREKYGSRLVSAVLHLDEETPHIHAVVVPVDEKNSLNCRAFLGGRKLLSQLQTEAGKAFEHLGLERGVERSGAKHTTVKQYYAAANSKFETVPKVTTPAPAQPGPEPTPPRIFSGSAARDKFAADLESWNARKAHYDAQLKKRQDEIRASNAAAHNLAGKYQAQAAESKFKEREMKVLKTENSRLSREVTELRKLVADLRGVDPVDVLQRVYGAAEDAGSRPSHRTRKFRAPGRESTIAVTDGLWVDNGTGKGGKGALNLVMELEGWGQDRFNDAVRLLAEHYSAGALARAVAHVEAETPAAAERIERVKAKPAPVRAPDPVPATWSRARRYLVTTRGMPAAVVDALHAEGVVYSDERSNVVFKRQRGCIKRGSSDPAGQKAFRQSLGPAEPFVLPGRPGAAVMVCEGPIDALALRAIAPGATIVATGGNCPPEALRAALQGAPKVLLCHDGDKAGQRQAQALAAELAAAGVPAERRHPPKPAKDWADALRADPGLAAAARHQAAEVQAESIQHQQR